MRAPSHAGVGCPGCRPGDTFLVSLPDADKEPPPSKPARAAAPVAAPARAAAPVAAPVTAPARAAESSADQVLAIEEALGENLDGAIKGLMPRMKNLEQALFGEVQAGKIPDRLAALQEQC